MQSVDSHWNKRRWMMLWKREKNLKLTAMQKINKKSMCHYCQGHTELSDCTEAILTSLSELWPRTMSGTLVLFLSLLQQESYSSPTLSIGWIRNAREKITTGDQSRKVSHKFPSRHGKQRKWITMWQYSKSPKLIPCDTLTPVKLQTLCFHTLSNWVSSVKKQSFWLDTSHPTHYTISRCRYDTI